MSTTKKTNGIFVLVALIGLFTGINLVNSAWSFMVDKITTVTVTEPTGTVLINGTSPIAFGNITPGDSKMMTILLENTSGQTLRVVVANVNNTHFSANIVGGFVDLPAHSTTESYLILEALSATTPNAYNLIIQFQATAI